MLYRVVSEVLAALAAEFSLPTYTKPNTSFTYVPWTESKKMLDQVFGVFGWSTTEPRVSFAAMTDLGKATGVYTVSFGLVVRALDDVSGDVVEKMLPCVGQGVSYGADDNAAKAAMSDALSRGVKMLGTAFGFELYEKSAPVTSHVTLDYPASATASTKTAAPGATVGPTGRGPSEKQRKILVEKLHFDPITVDDMPYAEWKPALDGYFQSIKGAF